MTQPTQHHGYPPPIPGGPYAYQAETKSPLIALICGIVSFLGPSIITAIPAIIFGVKGRKEADLGRNHSRGLATAGLVLGIISTLIFIAGLTVTMLIPALLHH